MSDPLSRTVAVLTVTIVPISSASTSPGRCRRSLSDCAKTGHATLPAFRKSATARRTHRPEPHTPNAIATNETPKAPTMAEVMPRMKMEIASDAAEGMAIPEIEKTKFGPGIRADPATTRLIAHEFGSCAENCLTRAGATRHLSFAREERPPAKTTGGRSVFESLTSSGRRW